MTRQDTAKASPWWNQAVHQDRRPRLTARARLRSALRGFFAGQGFLEVEPAALQLSPGNEAHIGGFATDFTTPEGASQRFYLHSSPEFACKKLLAAGEARIYALTPVWRNGERGPLHHPEFTMLEWYRADTPYAALIDDCRMIMQLAAEAAGARAFVFRDKTCDPLAEPERLTLCDAFARFVQIDLAACLNDRVALAREAKRLGIRVTDDDHWSDLFSKILSEKIEPHLGLGRVTVLDLYPASEAALARRSPQDPRFAERFELYACGIELANAFGELTDAHEQRQRFEQAMAQRQRIYGETYPIDDDFLAALDHMPDASGIALGFDRLVMLATGANHIEDVIWTPLAGAR
jgi:elongation factor P--(R)-beta-lysine ligase